MTWSIRKLNLKWYEYLWAALPIGIASIGGAIGGAVGGAALVLNIKLMQGNRSRTQKFLLTGLVTLAAAGLYVGGVRLFFSTVGAHWAATQRVDRELAALPLYTTIRDADPDTYQKIRDTMIDGAVNGRSVAEIGGALQPYVAKLTGRYLPVASDAAVLEFARVLTLEIDQIGAQSADACFYFLYPQAGAQPVRIDKLVTPEVIQKQMAAMSLVIQSAVRAPQPRPTRADASAAINQVVRQLAREFSPNDVAALARPATLGPAKACAMSSQMYKDTLTLPAAQSATMLRFLFAQTTAL